MQTPPARRGSIRRAARPTSGTSARTGPGRATQSSVSCSVNRLKDRAKLVIAVGPGSKHAQIEVDLGVRPRAARAARLKGGAYRPSGPARRSSSSVMGTASAGHVDGERRRIDRLIHLHLRQADRQICIGLAAARSPCRRPRREGGSSPAGQRQNRCIAPRGGLPDSSRVARVATARRHSPSICCSHIVARSA